MQNCFLSRKYLAIAIYQEFAPQCYKEATSSAHNLWDVKPRQPNTVSGYKSKGSACGSISKFGPITISDSFILFLPEQMSLPILCLPHGFRQCSARCARLLDFTSGQLSLHLHEHKCRHPEQPWLEIESPALYVWLLGKMRGKVHYTWPETSSVSCLIRWGWLKSWFWGSTWLRKQLLRIQGILARYFSHHILGFHCVKWRRLFTLCGGAW